MDREKFQCLGLAYQALEAGGTAPVALNAANEVAVAAFLDGRLPFLGIARVVGEVLDGHTAGEASSVEEILEIDQQARQRAGRSLEGRMVS